MAKLQYRIEVEGTSENIAALKAAGVEFKLLEVNEVLQGCDVFARTPNFKFTEIILNPVEEVDATEYTDQQLKNKAGQLLKNLPYEMTKEVRL